MNLSGFYKGMEKVQQGIGAVEKFFGIFAMAFIVLINIYGIGSRYIFNKPVLYIQELTILAAVSLFFIGMGLLFKVHSDISVRKGGQIAWAFRKNSPTLKAVVNQFVARSKQGTLHGNMILKRYLKENKWVRNSLSKDELEKFESMLTLFEKYAEKYGFDWAMLVALAYQESQLDQSRRSKAGAIGVMQMLPTTAKDPNVGISHIEKVENNVHAGTKYLRFLRDRYFNDPKIDDVNQTLLAFAAYNAGPARVARWSSSRASSMRSTDSTQSKRRAT